MTDILQSQLKSLGLGQTEALLYITGLRYSHAVGVQQLQSATNLKRPTIYHNLTLLESRGLVAKVRGESKTLYSFSDPSQLERSIESEVRDAKAKLRTLSLFMRELDALQPAKNDTKVSHYEGIQGVKTVVDMALFCRKPEWKVIAPVDNFFNELDRKYADYYLVTRKRHEIKSKTLWERPTEGRLLRPDEIIERQPRYLPSVMLGKFTSTMILFDNKVAIVNSVEEASAILIESAEVSQLFSAFFDGLWHTSTPYEEYHQAKINK